MIEIAKILKPQGIKGEVKALSSTNVSEIFSTLKQCLIGNKLMHIQHISSRQGFLYIKFEEINSRNDAENYRNQSLFIEKSQLEMFLDDDKFLVDDIIGMVIYDENGEMVGQVLDIVNYGASDIVILEKDKRQYEVPYIDEVFKKVGDKLIADSKKLLEVMVWLLIFWPYSLKVLAI